MVKEWRRYSVVLALMLLVLSTVTVFASNHAPSEAGNAVNSFFKGVLDFAAAAMGLGDDVNGNPLVIIPYIFISILLFLFIHVSVQDMKFFGDDRSANIFNILVSLSVTIVAIIALPQGFLTVVLPSYGAMGAAILTVIPFLMIFWFSIKTHSIAMAKITWGMFALYYFAYYIGLAWGWITPFGLQGPSEFSWIYGIMGVAGLAMFWAIPLFRHLLFNATIEDVENDIKNATKLINAVNTSKIEEADSSSKAVKGIS